MMRQFYDKEYPHKGGKNVGKETEYDLDNIHRTHGGPKIGERVCCENVKYTNEESGDVCYDGQNKKYQGHGNLLRMNWPIFMFPGIHEYQSQYPKNKKYKT